MSALDFAIPTPPTLMAVPDFVAGLLYGMTTENHLTEIEACWTAGTPVEEDLMMGIHDLKHGGKNFEIQAILEFALAALNVPIALKTCEQMGPDIKAIESWATIFENKTKLVATVTRRYALHRNAIKADIATVENEWALGEYYKAGVTAADLLYLAVGPIPAPNEEPMDYGLAGPAFTIPEPPTLMAVPDFVAGLLYGMTTENHLTEIENCWTSGTPVEKDFMIGIHDLHHGGWDFEIQAILEFGLAALNIPIALKQCSQMGPDIKAIEQWASIFEDRTKLIADVTKRYALHRKAIKADIGTCKEEWALGEYYKTGVTAADLLYLAVGPIPAPAA